MDPETNQNPQAPDQASTANSQQQNLRPDEPEAINKSFSLKRPLLITVIVALCLSALMGIFVFLFGSFGEIEFKILMTTLAIGGFSLTGLCCSILFERGSQKTLSIAGMIISGLALIYSIFLVWEIVDIFGEDSWKWWVILLILSFSTAHSSIMLLISSARPLVRSALYATLVFISAVAILTILLVLSDEGFGDFYFRIVGVFAILDVLGTIVTPILNKAFPNNSIGAPQVPK